MNSTYEATTLAERASHCNGPVRDPHGNAIYLGELIERVQDKYLLPMEEVFAGENL